MSSTRPTLTPDQVKAAQDVEASRLAYVSAIDLVTNTWSGFRHILLSHGLEAALEHISDMPDALPKHLATMVILEYRKTDVVRLSESDGTYPCSAADRENVRRAFSSAQSAYFEASFQVLYRWKNCPAYKAAAAAGDHQACLDILATAPDCLGMATAVGKLLDKIDEASSLTA